MPRRLIHACDHLKSALLLLVLLHSAIDTEGIKCFQCSSLKDPECSTLSALYGSTPTTVLSAFTAGLNSTGTQPAPQASAWRSDFDVVQKVLRHYRDCDDTFGGKRKPFCRKMEQMIFARNNLMVVTRSCGWEKHSNRDCYNYENKGHTEVVCQCFEDGCNVAPGGAWAAATLVASLSVLLRLL